MNKWLIGAIVIGLIVFSVVWSTVFTHRAEVLPVDELIPEDWMPGNELPAHVYCSYPPYHIDTISCSPLGDDNIFISYNYRTNQIYSVLLLNQRWTVGELILAWGTPTGATSFNSGHMLYWGKKVAYISGGFFSPASKTYFVEYLLTVKPDSAWQGFTNTVK